TDCATMTKTNMPFSRMLERAKLLSSATGPPLSPGISTPTCFQRIHEKNPDPAVMASAIIVTTKSAGFQPKAHAQGLSAKFASMLKNQIVGPVSRASHSQVFRVIEAPPPCADPNKRRRT